tara:strand:- start:7453 stop:9336 length:1884 start_codon:yes stop_codon:yes gene_type:complete
MGLQTVKKDLRYLNKDFSQFRSKLIDYSKTYFPDTFNDFNESSPGMIFMEMAAYVGDVLSYYIDNQLRESLLTEAQERSNIMSIARGLGYKVKPTCASTVELDVFILLPPAGSGANVVPDFSYAPVIDEGMRANAPQNGAQEFFTTSPIDFAFSSSIDPTDISVYKIDSNGNPESFLLKKTVFAKSGIEKSRTFDFDSPIKFDKRLLPEANVVEVLNVVDSDGNKYYEVDYLAQETSYVDIKNTALQDEELSQFNEETPYLLKLRRTGRRFVTNIRADMSTELLFGAGNSGQADELIVPNPDNVGLALPYGNVSQIDNAWDPSNTMFTRAYGQAPSNTDLKVKYLVGGGVESNVSAGTITDITSLSFTLDTDGLTASTIKFVEGSIAVNNPRPASGGKSAETIEEIRQNALAFFAAQNRAVTREDYIARIYSMPGRFGNVAKAYLIQDEQENEKSGQIIKNPLAINCYILAYNSSKQLTNANIVTKENIRNYLSQFRLLTDAVNIKDGFIINLGVDFSIVPLPGYQGKEVLANCILRIQDLFSIDKWQFNEPIFLGNVATEIDKVEGVQSVVDLQVHCKFDKGSGYSGNFYDINAATKNKIIYPSQDPAIFEIKYPSKDIRGKVVSY